MRKNIALVFLILLAALAFYRLGKNASNRTSVNIVQNVELIKEIAELGSLDVKGTTRLKMTNKADNPGLWNKFRDYFAENTLLLTIPYEAKYGVDMANRQLKIDTKEKSVIIFLPECKLLSLQLRLDQVEAISKTGLLSSISIDDYVKAQKQLYEEGNANLGGDAKLIKLAEEHIRFIIEKYYKPMGFTVECRFGAAKNALQ